MAAADVKKERNHYFITGTSRGLGQALARRLLGPDNVLFCFSRSLNPELSRLAEESGWPLPGRRAGAAGAAGAGAG